MSPEPAPPPERLAGLSPEFGKARSMIFPRVVLAGHNVLPALAETCQEFGFASHGAVVTGPTTKALAGDRCAEILSSAGFTMNVIVAHEATEAEVSRVAQEVTQSRAAFLVAVGGGSKIDIAKVVAARNHVPFISVPTSAAHDGISSPRASLHGRTTSTSIEGAMPVGILADTSLIVQAPFRLLASGCADVISNLTAVLDWKLAVRLRNEEYSSTAAMFAEYSAQEIIDHAGLIKAGLEESAWIAIRPMLIAGIAMSVAGSSRPCSGSEHLFSHALDTIAARPALHGEQCGVGAIMMMHLHGGDWRRVQHALATIGAPTTAAGLGVTNEEVIRALMKAHSIRPERYTILGGSGLTRDAAERLARITGVIS